MIVVGSRLGPYEIVERIGAGGMGEVWRGRDTRLDRSVAIKILTGELATNSQLKLRFEREAKTISQLNHPHICTLHDVGDEDGTPYLVMELVDGETLAERLTRGPLPLRDVARYGAQIAGALDRAHRAGIIHRDLKPGNVMLTKSGAKLLDFGLAKSGGVIATASQSRADEPTAVRTDEPLTAQGTILGTFQYMAPEQLEGDDADPRTDIFALGVVLYEMLTGRRAFEGKTKTSLIASIVGGAPRPIAELQPLTPPALEHVITKCIEKEPDDRWQSAHDIAEELRWISGASEAAAPRARSRGLRRETIAWALCAIAVAGGAYASWRAFGNAPARIPSLRLDFGLPPQTMLDRSGNPIVALSPDGTTIVYVAPQQGVNRLFVRQLDRFDVTQLAGTERATSPFFSPDGAAIGFFADGLLKKIATSGGATVALCSAPTPRGGAWGDDGSIYFAPNPSGGVFRISESGGTPVEVARPDVAKNELSYRWPALLPDGKHILVTVKTGGIGSFDEARIGVVPVAGGKATTLVEGGSFGRYVDSGHIAYVRSGNLYAVRFDPESLKVSGTPVQVLEGVLSLTNSGSASYSVSRDGALVYLPAPAGKFLFKLFFADREGKRTMVADDLPQIYAPRLSPDERTVALDIGAANDDIALLDVARGTVTRLSFEPANEGFPVWTPDGSHVIYQAENPVAGGEQIVMKAADGSGASDELVRSVNTLQPTSVSPDGTLLAYVETDPKSRSDVWILSLADRKKSVLMQSPFNERAAAFSPDGRWIAYESDESGRLQVYVRSIAAGGGRWQISTDGGETPHWSRDGRELFYWNQQAIYRVAIESTTRFAAGRPEKLLAIAKDPFQDYDVAMDGRFLFNSDSGDVELRQLRYISNWFDDLERQVPAK